MHDGGETILDVLLLGFQFDVVLKFEPQKLLFLQYAIPESGIGFPGAYELIMQVSYVG